MERLTISRWLSQKDYGFAVPEGAEGQVVFCHLRRFRVVEPDGNGGVCWRSASGDPLELELRKGATIFAEIETGERGPRAKAFCLEDNYCEAEQASLERPTYRLIEVTGTMEPTKLFNELSLRERVVVETNDLAVLKAKLPSRWRVESPKNREKFLVRYKFQALRPDGSWQDCRPPISMKWTK